MNCTKEISRRIAMAKEAFNKRKEILRRSLDVNLRERIVKTIIWPVVLYGSETWTIKKNDTKRLQAFEMWIWRRMLKVSWKDMKTNEEVLQEIKEDRNLLNTVR